MARAKARKVIAIDCETDPFLHGRVPEPFIWGAFDGAQYFIFDRTEDFVDWFRDQDVILYAHNGGKFDFMFLLSYLEETKVKIIKGRLAEIRIGKAILRDSFSIIPTALAAFQKSAMDYTKLEANVRRQHMPEIIQYLKDDCRDLFNIVTAFRKTAGKGLTIAGNALAQARALGINIKKTNHKHDEIFRPYFYGGHCEAFKGGSFEDVDIWDIKSAYPFAMLNEHATGREYTFKENPDTLPQNITKSFLKIECYSAGALPYRDKSGLSFPHRHDIYNITGWEFQIAIRHNLLRDVKILESYEFTNSINFKSYVDKWFQLKTKSELEGDKANRHVAKIMLNSLYGKMAQNPVQYKDYKIVPAGTDPDEGWLIECAINEKEIHARPSLYKLQQKHGDDWVTFPIFYNVATGASITGFVRAMLIDTIHKLGADKVIYCDTDSVFTLPGTKTEQLRMDGDVGAWEHEGHATECHIGGKKLYAAKLDWPEDGKEKIATKGARLTFSQIKKIIQNDETFLWKNDAPSFKINGSAEFVRRIIRPTFKRNMENA